MHTSKTPKASHFYWVEHKPTFPIMNIWLKNKFHSWAQPYFPIIPVIRMLNQDLA